MDIPTNAAKSITEFSHHECDARVKQLLSNKVILAQIVKGCVTEFENTPANEIAEKYIEGEPEVSTVPVNRDETNSPLYNKSEKIKGFNIEDRTDTEGTVYYDIRFSAISPSGNGKIGLIINIEAQKKYNPGYPIVSRGEYYCCRMISAQKGIEFERSDYGAIKKVYSIWICYNAQHAQNTMIRYRMIKDDVIGHVDEPEENYDKMQIIIIGLGDPREDDVGTVLHFLDVLFSNQLNPKEIMNMLEDKYNIPMTDKLESEMSEMCNISWGIEEKGIEKGRAEGIEIGKLEILINLVKKNLLSIHDASTEANMSEQQFASIISAHA